MKRLATRLHAEAKSLKYGLALAVSAWMLPVVAAWIWGGWLSHVALGMLGLVAIGLGYRHLRRTHEALRQSEERFRLISSVAMDYVFSSVVEPDGRLVLQWVVGGFEEITGYSYNEYVARGGWQAMVHPDDRAQDARDMQTLQTNTPLKTELRTICKSGKTIWVEVMAQPVWDPTQNRLVGICGAVKDITRRKLAEAETQATYDTLKQFVDSVPAFASYVDQEERYQFVNRFYEDWFHQPRAHFVGRRLEEVHRPATYATLRPYSQKALSGELVRYESEMTGRDGKYYCFDVQYIPRRASDGSVLGYFTLVFDITERVLRDRQLLRTQRLESVGRLASGIAHDLNNILAPMMMGPDLLRETTTDPASLNILEVIESSAKRGADILKQLLMFGRGEQEVSASLHLGPLIREMIKIMEETFPKNITVLYRIPSDLPAIQGNVTHLHQVLMNLCINARDAMPHGGTLSLTAQVEDIQENMANRCEASVTGPHVVLGVEDTGSGIPPEILDKIYDPFFTTKPLGKGTGLGLSTVLGIVRSHHGFIRVNSQTGHGTQFRIYLPARAGKGNEEAQPVSPESPTGQGEHILLVDDEASARHMTRQMLEQKGYHVLEAQNGKEALEIFERDPSSIQLVITDLMMPIMDGTTFLRQLRQKMPGVKTIAVTGGLSQAELAQAMESESSAFILKPFGATTLLETIRRVLEA